MKSRPAKRTCNARSCVCVCHPLCQRVHCHRYRHHHFPKQGGREDLQGSAQRSSLQDPSRKRKLITSVYLLVTLPHSSLLWFGAMVFDHDTLPSNRFPTADLQQTCNHTDCQSANIVQPYSSCRLFRHAVPSPSFPTWELSVAEYQCQSVFRSAVPLGC